jgi:hypothetical protein
LAVLCAGCGLRLIQLNWNITIVNCLCSSKPPDVDLRKLLLRLLKLLKLLIEVDDDFHSTDCSASRICSVAAIADILVE